jgi:hypothetical protein
VGEGRFADEAAERVGRMVAEAYAGVLGDRLATFVTHGSSVTGGYIPGYSDLDFYLFMHGRLTFDDGIALQNRLGEADIAPFGYVQLSRVVDLDDPNERWQGAIDGAYVLVIGALPNGWTFHDEDSLRTRGREALDRIPARLDEYAERWSRATRGRTRERIVRNLITDVKPALRALLAELGEPVLDVWRAPYPDLARRWTMYDAEAGERFRRLLGQLPPPPDREADVGREFMKLLQTIDAGRGRCWREPGDPALGTGRRRQDDGGRGALRTLRPHDPHRGGLLAPLGEGGLPPPVDRRRAVA